MKVQQSPQLANLLPPLDPEEAAVLQEQLRTDRVPQVFPYCVVNGTNYQLDGHHRLPICVKEKIKFSWQCIEHVTSIPAAIAWIKATQLGRRNATPEQKAALRRERVVQARLDGMSTHAIAEQEGVSQATVRRDLEAQVRPPVSPGVESPDLDAIRQENASLREQLSKVSVTGKDGKKYQAKGETKKRNTGPKPFTIKEWESDFGKIVRGVGDLKALLQEAAANHQQLRLLDDAVGRLEWVYNTMTNAARALPRVK